MIKQKIQTLLAELNHGIIDRESAIKAALLTVLAGENMVLIGPPGTAKSMVARRVAEGFEHPDGASGHGGYFEYLLTKFSTPEEIFGPLSISELKADRFKRNTAGYLPTVKLAFLDEIFKASSSILNSLLTILNERIYHNGAEVQQTPLMSLIAASNELPTAQEELSALYDRFLIRQLVDNIHGDKLAELFHTTSPKPVTARLTAEDLQMIRNKVASVSIPEHIIDVLRQIWTKHNELFKEDATERLSDRRLKKSANLLRVSAATNGRDEVDLSDVLLLKNCLWNHAKNAEQVRELVIHTLQKHSHSYTTEDGKAIAKLSMIAGGNKGKSAATIKGFTGSGTPEDPFLVESLEHLVDLARPEVGLNGYYFKQSSDIDCSELTHWEPIEFNGHYNGYGRQIKWAKEIGGKALFGLIKDNSSVTRLDLQGVTLAEKIENSEIKHCQSNHSLIFGDIKNSKISYCQSSLSITDGSGIDSIVSHCKSGFCMIKDKAVNCTVRNCIIDIDFEINKKNTLATYLIDANDLYGITNDCQEKTIIEQCYISIQIENPCRYEDVCTSGISNACHNSILKDNALVKLNVKGRKRSDIHRLFNFGNNNECKNNFSSDINQIGDNNEECDGKTIASISLTKRFFENTLGWDFDKTWDWDAENNQPYLRNVGVKGNDAQDNQAPSTSTVTDNLGQQLKANIWL